MLPATIEHYLRPPSVAEALAAIARFDAGEAMFLAGGQSAMQALKSRMLRPQCIIDLQDIAELKGIQNDARGLRIGAMTRYVEVAAAGLPGAFAALRDAASHVGDRQVRNRGTIGGSVCWNYLASCTPAVVLGLGGNMNLLAADGSARTVAADDFFLGPLETARRDDEILLAVSWPVPSARSGSAYKKWGLVTDALPVVGVCVLLSVDAQDKCTAVRISLAGLAGGAQRAEAGEQALLGTTVTTDTIAAAMQAIADSVETHSDMSADANYRKQLIRTIGCEVAQTALARARA